MGQKNFGKWGPLKNKVQRPKLAFKERRGNKRTSLKIMRDFVFVEDRIFGPTFWGPLLGPT